MPCYSITEARRRLPELIDRAVAGEEVVITRRGMSVVEFQAARSPQAEPKPVTLESILWLEKAMVGRSGPEDAGQLVSRMRDEDWA